MVLYGGYPRDNGATDYMDSSRLAGMLSTFGYPEFEMPCYFVDQKPVRCAAAMVPNDPCRNPKNFSRDQLIPLITGYYFQHQHGSVKKINDALKFIFCPNWDPLSPSQLSHIDRCMGKSGSHIGDAWLELDIWYNSKNPLQEPNQLLCMLMTAGPSWVAKWKRANSQWEKSIRTYWEGFRNEKEVSDLIVNKIIGM